MGQTNQQYTGEVAESLAIVTVPPLPGMIVGVDYQTWIEATGGIPPYTFTVEGGGPLPDGLVLEPTGNLHGIPTATGPYDFNVVCTDAA